MVSLPRRLAPNVRHVGAIYGETIEQGASSAPAPVTEAQNAATVDLDLLDTRDLLRLLNDEDRRAAWAVERELDDIADVVDAIAERLAHGGHLHYFGAGSSGRMGVLDAAEIPPTFGTPPDLVTAHIAGGDRAIRHAIEGAEDDEQSGRDAARRTVRAADAVVGISASGSAANVLGAIRAARELDALTIGITNSLRTPLEEAAQLCIILLTGPEALTGSTRMKAATAQKMALNMISTAVMVKLGKVYGNLMVDVAASSKKLRARALRLTIELGRADEAKARAVLEASGYQPKIAIVMLRRNCDVAAAEALLREAGGFLREVID